MYIFFQRVYLVIIQWTYATPPLPLPDAGFALETCLTNAGRYVYIYGFVLFLAKLMNSALLWVIKHH